MELSVLLMPVALCYSLPVQLPQPALTPPNHSRTAQPMVQIP